jgi:hypothetical protein
MNAAALLIGELSLLDVHLIVDGEDLRYQGPKGTVTPEHLHRLKALKPEIRQRLLDQEQEIAWRVHLMLATDSFVVWEFPPRPGFCLSCDEPVGRNEGDRCALCRLAAVRVGRVVDGLDAPPEEVPAPDPVRLPSWDCVCGANVVGDWTYCPHPDCGRPRTNAHMHKSPNGTERIAS